MQYFVGLDVATISSSICIVNEKGRIVCESSLPTKAQSIHEYLSSKKIKIDKIALESGSLSHFLAKEIAALGWTITCMDARSLAPFMNRTNKTDRNDARGIAEALRTDSKKVKYVYQKSEESIDLGVLLAARRTLVRQRTMLSNTMKGLLKSFGIILPPSGVTTIAPLIREKLEELWPSTKPENQDEEASKDLTSSKKFTPTYLPIALESLIRSFTGLTQELDAVDALLLNLSRKDPIIKRLMTMPGIGFLTAITYKTVIDNPLRFRKSRSVGAYLGMCSTQYSSGQVKRYGRISKEGSKELRTLLASAGICLLRRCKAPSTLKDWGLKIEQKHGLKKAATAAGRKMAVIMHRMWIENTSFAAESIETTDESTT